MSNNLQDRIAAWESNQFELIEGGALLEDLIPAYHALMTACEAATKRADAAERKLQWLCEHVSCDYPASKDGAVDVTTYEWTWGFIVTAGDDSPFEKLIELEMAKTPEQRQAEQQWVKRKFFPEKQAALVEEGEG